MKNTSDQFFLIMLMDLVNENLLTMEEAEMARRYYLKDGTTESPSKGMESGKVA